MADYTPYQQKIIKRYYRNFDAIKFQRLSELATDLYLPARDGQALPGRWPALLARTPYNKSLRPASSALQFARHGYLVAVQDCRGRFLSEGRFFPFVDEPEDGASAVRASEVAAVTAEMLRKIKPLAGAGDIVAGEAVAPRRRVAVQILRVASDYDDLTAGDQCAID